MTTTWQDIRGALQTRARLVGGIPASIAVEGKQFSPTAGTPYVAFKVHPTAERPKSIGPAGMTRIDGLFLIDVCYPNKAGTGDVETMADLVKAMFQPGTPLTSGSTTVKILSAERGPTIEQPDWIRVPVTITWFAYILTIP